MAQSVSVPVGLQNLQPPPPLLHSANMADNWRRFRRDFDIYMIATGGFQLDDGTKLAIFLHVIGEESRNTYDTFEWTDTTRPTYKDTVQKFEDIYSPQKNESVQTHIFNKRIQRPGESFEKFLEDLRWLSSNCNFGVARNRLIRDRIVDGISSHRLKEQLLSDKKLTLEKAIDICRQFEATQEQLKLINTGSEKDVFAINNNNRYKNRYVVKEKVLCQKCGYQHQIGRCPAFGKTCVFCKGKNHFAKQCYKRRNEQGRKVNCVEEQVQQNNTKGDGEEKVFIGSMETNGNYNNLERDWYQKIRVENKMWINFKLDSGSQVKCQKILKIVNNYC